MRPRIIVVGAAWYGDWAKGFYQACLRLDFRTSIVYNNSTPSILGGNSDAVTSLFERSKRFVKRVFGKRFFRLLKKIRVQLSDYEILSRVGKADNAEGTVIVVFTWTPGSPWVLKRLRAKKNIILVLWLGEPPIRDALWELTYQYFNYLYVVDEGIWMDELPEKQKKRAKLLPLASDETVFHPLAEPHVAYRADISFVGQYVASRASTLSALKDYDLKIYGFGWERGFGEFPWLKKNYKGPLPTSALNLVYNSTKVVVGTLGAPEDPHTTATMRTFDIALAGGFQISQDVALTKKLFGRSIPTYKNDEEFVSLVKHYLAHEDERRKLAAESHTLALNHSYTARAKQILRDCGF